MATNETERLLDLMRRGHANFQQCIAALSDEQMAEPSRLPGWSRKHVLAHVGLNAIALGRLTRWAKTGHETPMYLSTDCRVQEIEAGALLPVSELREQSVREQHALEAGLASLSDSNWLAMIKTAQGRALPATVIPWLRTRELWIHAVDLDAGAGFEDFPTEFVDLLVSDATTRWAAAGYHLQVLSTDRAEPRANSQPTGIAIGGSTRNLARWLTGRGQDGVNTRDGTNLPTLGPWL